MTWPFENDTDAIIKKLAGRSMKADKRSRAFLILTIAISVCMVCSIILISAGAQEEFKNTQRNKAQIAMIGITDGQLSALRQSKDVQWAGEYAAIGLFYSGNETVTVAYGSEDYFTHQEEKSIQGRAPDGSTFAIDAAVTGVYSTADLMARSPVVPGSPYFMMTYDMAKKLTGITEQTGVLAISAAPGKFDEVLGAVQELAEQNGKILVDTIEQTVKNIRYRYSAPIKALYMAGGILFTFGSISLMNMLTVDFQNRKREFGLLEAAGATRKQLTAMLRRGDRRLPRRLAGGVACAGSCRQLCRLLPAGRGEPLHHAEAAVAVSRGAHCRNDSHLPHIHGLCRGRIEENGHTFRHTRRMKNKKQRNGTSCRSAAVGGKVIPASRRSTR